MKYICLLLLGTFLFVMGVSAQHNNGISFAFGPRFGFNLANASYSPDQPSILSKGSRMGILFGGVAEMHIADFANVQVEPTYIQKGDKLTLNQDVQLQDGTTLPNGTTITDQLSELDIPILFKAKFETKSPIRPYAIAGPTIAFVLSSNQHIEVQGGQTSDNDAGSTTSSIDFGLLFGAGAEYTVAHNIGLTFDIRYQLGLSNLDSQSNAQAQQGQQQQQNAQSQSIKSGGIQFAIGALFSI